MYLGIDWGHKKIGLAVAQDDPRVAMAHATIDNDRDVFTRLAQIIAAQDIQMIVLGRSAHVHCADNTAAIDRFATQCRARCGVPVVYAPEMFSSREAQQNLIAGGRKHVHLQDDAEAARIILQSYLDAQNVKM